MYVKVFVNRYYCAEVIAKLARTANIEEAGKGARRQRWVFQEGVTDGNRFQGVTMQ